MVAVGPTRTAGPLSGSTLQAGCLVDKPHAHH